MPRLRAARVGPLVLATLLLVGCGGGSSSTVGSGSAPTTADLDGTVYVSSSVEGHDLVPGSHLRLEFHDGTMNGSAGCNTLTGPYDVQGGRLSWTQAPAMTMMACREPLMQQDQWLSDWLRTGADATLDGDVLTVTSGGVTVRLQPEAPADASTLLGRTWKVIELTTPTSAATIPPGVRTPTFEVAADGTVLLDTGCNRGHTTVTADGDTLRFGPVMTTKMACPSAAADVEQAVLQALQGDVTVANAGDTATLDNGHHGLVVRLGPHTGS